MTDRNKKPVVNFVVLQSVEDYVEKSGKFRTNCASFTIPGADSGGANTVYLPYCEKQRFDYGKQLTEYRGHGVFKPPQTGKSWGIPDFVVYREHFHDIHCPQPCRGYRNKRVAALLEKLRWRRRSAKTDGKWTKKEIVTAIVVPLVAVLIGAVLAWMTPEGRRWIRLDKPQEQHAPIVPQSAPHSDSAPTQSKPEQIVTPSKDRGKQKAQPPKAQSQEPKPPQVNAPNGIAIGGGNVFNPTVNNYGPALPTPTFELFDKPPLPDSTAPQQWIRIAIDKTFLDPKFAVVCDRPCKVLKADVVLVHSGIAQVDWGRIPNDENIAAISVNQPNPMPSEVKVEAVIVSQDDKPFKILSVQTLTIGAKK